MSLGAMEGKKMNKSQSPHLQSSFRREKWSIHRSLDCEADYYEHCRVREELGLEGWSVGESAGWGLTSGCFMFLRIGDGESNLCDLLLL